jgi:hypothetical protein
MKVYPKTAVRYFLDDRVVYRNLEPADPNLPGLKELSKEVGVQPGKIPRKVEPEYARAMVHLLKIAQGQRGCSEPIRRLIYVGDTHLLDGTAYGNICQAGDWEGLAFIGSENDQPISIQTVIHPNCKPLYLANRWAALPEFARYASTHNMPVDESTAVIIDLDKTALGARGRNDRVIDQARINAVKNTMAILLGEAFDLEDFLRSYRLLNQPEFHPFTADNQDYLAYVCLMLGSQLFRLDQVVEDVRAGRLKSFHQFIEIVNEKRNGLSPELAEIHSEIYAHTQAGDPTPFKLFRRNEYLCTIERFGNLADNAPLELYLEQEILITQEVRGTAQIWSEQGALLFGLSDKPDEAAIPTLELAKQGYQPIHRAMTHAVGEVIQEYKE